MKKIFAIGLILVLTFSLIGCGGGAQEESSADNNSQQSEEATLSGTVVIAGSTSVQPLSEEIASEFMRLNPDVSIEVQGGGSSVGVKSAADEVADIGAASRELKDSEEGLGLTKYVIAKDGIAIVVNPSCEVSDLTLEQIKKIFTGEITNWSEVGGADRAITAVSREEGSGTRGAFVEISGVESKDENGDKVDKTTENALVQPSTGAVKQTVANTPDTIGYISLGALDDTVKALKVEGAEASNANVLDGSYKIARPFLYLTKGEISETTQAYIDFVMSASGQEIVGQEFIPVK